MDFFNLPQEKLKLNPTEVAAYEEVSNFLATQLESTWISGAPTLSPEAQMAFTIVVQRTIVELTWAKLAKKLGEMRTEVVSYLVHIKVC